MTGSSSAVDIVVDSPKPDVVSVLSLPVVAPHRPSPSPSSLPPPHNDAAAEVRHRWTIEQAHRSAPPVSGRSTVGESGDNRRLLGSLAAAAAAASTATGTDVAERKYGYRLAYGGSTNNDSAGEASVGQQGEEYRGNVLNGSNVDTSESGGISLKTRQGSEGGGADGGGRVYHEIPRRQRRRRIAVVENGADGDDRRRSPPRTAVTTASCCGDPMRSGRKVSSVGRITAAGTRGVVAAMAAASVVADQTASAASGTRDAACQTSDEEDASSSCSRRRIAPIAAAVPDSPIYSEPFDSRVPLAEATCPCCRRLRLDVERPERLRQLDGLAKLLIDDTDRPSGHRDSREIDAKIEIEIETETAVEVSRPNMSGIVAEDMIKSLSLIDDHVFCTRL